MPLKNGYLSDFSAKNNLSLSKQYLIIYKKLQKNFKLYKDTLSEKKLPTIRYPISSQICTEEHV